MKTGVVILGHGSRAEEAKRVFNEIISMIKEKVNYEIVRGASMELAEPNLEQTIETIADKVDKISIVPLFLFPGIHIQEDIPGLIDELREEYPEIEFEFGENIGADEKIADIMVDRIEKVV
ncbi:sirohydrochlorin chelatase [Sporohalobacter salinus]|uniref:sirohydrochlorin chelatase n=1 Tax=Sporohalobacter salinus TaxID=1494606 RepID=UPI0019610EC8|nr:CbiX/SirB N-terminal domain-containing protein [Sporohalobacter salinus]MBM7624414.1 sirohydrochlorin ferrochelatase [Sporohalobacter salinus]